ncbi:hypothetical protein PRIPAC_87390 [Pristionchus pacificus]|uniref:Uncharacterized protein n=1 Tax=Pristionchus pacificus TaxID=54126 RepID=A0A2A6CY49_PRIPA|nr:hypothetical protein PRIPAC_87390 [Pristionchus pacificus]|eukprot:PDM83058.1 hypothetical protein PRIPAC_37451 [Pristionchus pacificus]
MNARQFKEAAKEFYCGVISITAGAQIMSLIIMVIAVVSEAVTIATQRDPVEQVIVAVVVLFQLVSAGLVLLAISKRILKLMMPMLAFCVLLLSGLVILFVLLLIRLFRADIEFETEMMSNSSGANNNEFPFIFFSIFSVIVNFFIVLWSLINFTFCNEHLQKLER